MALLDTNEFCRVYSVEISLVNSFFEKGFIEPVIQEEKVFIDEEHLPLLERLLRLHTELEINFEGLEAIIHLLHKIEDLQNELIIVKNRLRLYE